MQLSSIPDAEAFGPSKTLADSKKNAARSSSFSVPRDMRMFEIFSKIRIPFLYIRKEKQVATRSRLLPSLRGEKRLCKVFRPI